MTSKLQRINDAQQAEIKRVNAMFTALADQAYEKRITGWPAGMLQDDSRALSKALANSPHARQHAIEASAAINGETK